MLKSEKEAEAQDKMLKWTCVLWKEKSEWTKSSGL